MKRAARENVKAWVVLTPIFIYFAIFTVVPVIIMAALSLSSYGEVTVGGQMIYQWIGLRNFATVFENVEYLKSFFYTFLIAVGVVAAGMLFGFFVAVALKSIPKGKGFFRTVWYLPALIAAAVMSQFVNILLAPDGTVNKLVEAFGGELVYWKTEVGWMYFWIIFVVSWQGIGGTALLFLAGMNGISEEIYEAAELDGASGLRKIWSITLPLLRPMTGFILITGFMGAFNIFEPVKLISADKPLPEVKVILYRLYDEAFVNYKYGFASALSVLTMIIVFVLTLFNIKISDNGIYKLEKKHG